MRVSIRTDRVKMLGVRGSTELKANIAHSHLGAVIQACAGSEFNVPSKIMNYLAVGLRIVASVNPESEAASTVREAGAGWIADSAKPADFAGSVVEALSDPDELTKRGEAGASFAPANLTPDVLADKFEEAIGNLDGPRR